MRCSRLACINSVTLAFRITQSYRKPSRRPDSCAGPKLAPLVNAILRRALRERLFDAEAVYRRGAVRSSAVDARYVANGLARRLVNRDLAANNARAPMWLRVNPEHGSAGRLRRAARGRRRFDSELLIRGAAGGAAGGAASLSKSLPEFAAGHVVGAGCRGAARGALAPGKCGWQCARCLRSAGRQKRPIAGTWRRARLISPAY